MRQYLHRILLIGLGGIGLLLFITGCTLAGASEAPLTPVGPGGVIETQPIDAGPQEETGGQLPIPTEDTGAIDVFGTQTASAAAAAVEPSEEVTPEPVITEEPTEAATEEVTPDQAASEVPPEETQAAVSECPATHVVQPGENLYRIALKYGLTVAQLAEANGITNPDSVAAGTVLTIPGCGSQPGSPPDTTGAVTTHTVQPGENLFRIALLYGITWQELAAFNNITDPTTLYVGQVLQIPASSQ